MGIISLKTSGKIRGRWVLFHLKYQGKSGGNGYHFTESIRENLGEMGHYFTKKFQGKSGGNGYHFTENIRKNQGEMDIISLKTSGKIRGRWVLFH